MLDGGDHVTEQRSPESATQPIVGADRAKGLPTLCGDLMFVERLLTVAWDFIEPLEAQALGTKPRIERASAGSE
jgi:hypothetical protein